MADHLRSSPTSRYTACGRDERDLSGGADDMTRDPAKVTCGSCKRTGRFANVRYAAIRDAHKREDGDQP